MHDSGGRLRHAQPQPLFFHLVTNKTLPGSLDQEWEAMARGAQPTLRWGLELGSSPRTTLSSVISGQHPVVPVSLHLQQLEC